MMKPNKNQSVSSAVGTPDSARSVDMQRWRGEIEEFVRDVSAELAAIYGGIDPAGLAEIPSRPAAAGEPAANSGPGNPLGETPPGEPAPGEASSRRLQSLIARLNEVRIEETQGVRRDD